MSSSYSATIGLEIHAELKTASKMFCSCKNDPDEERPNTNVCEICLGHPGTLPLLNIEAIHNVLRVGTAVGGSLADFTEWDRKNYFYPDIPKGYQISQYKYPLVSGGTLSGIEIERIHLEEDTAQSTHDQHEKSLVNFNRSGVPLMELVTKPVIHDADTAVAFAKELQLLLRYLGAGDANMEKGEMRVEANISVAPEGATTFGTKTEVKNLNSFKAVEGAIAYEIRRQIDVIEKGGKVVQETRGWSEPKQSTFSQRTKESSHDYRYFPDPDIPKMKISEILEFSTDKLRSSLPELPWQLRERLSTTFGMTAKEVAVFVETPALASYFDKVVSLLGNDTKKSKLATNYILTDYLGALKTRKLSFDTKAAIPPASFAELISMISAGDLSSRGAKDTLSALVDSPTASPRTLADSLGLIQKSDPVALIPVIETMLAANEKAIAEYKAGKTASLQFLVGQAMKATKGAGNPEMLKKIILEKIS